MPLLQDVIHKFEEGPWMRYLRVGLSVLAVVALPVIYDWRQYRNLASQEAMDSAQVGRQLSEGKGFTTLFLRQLSLHLVKEKNLARANSRGLPAGDDPAMIKEVMHPDLANPPVYPVLLAGLMKVAKPKWNTDELKVFLGQGDRYWRYKPDFMIALLNQFLFLVVIGLTFLLARHLFDPAVAWTSGLLLLACEVLWRFSLSGLSTMLLLVIFLGLIWFLVLVEGEAREPKRGPRVVFLFAVGAGSLLALGMLTRYSFGWLLLPVVVWVALFGGPRRAVLCLLVVATFTFLVSPWIYRNLRVGGLPFGTASYAAIQETQLVPNIALDRSLTPRWGVLSLGGRETEQRFWLKIWISSFVQKLAKNSHEILWEDLPRLGGNWLAPLFLAGLLLGFRNPSIRRLRYFILMSLGTLVIVQALGRTQLSTEAPEFNSENLVVLAVPVVFIYGAGLFYLLLDQMNLPYRGFRIVVIGLFMVIMALPMMFSFLAPRPVALAYPPYHPALIRTVSGWMRENELMMSDVPWAVAWYGHRQCLWLSPDPHEEFFAVNDLLKPVRGLFLTPVTLDARFATQWEVGSRRRSWGNLLFDITYFHQSFPTDFPLRYSLPRVWPNHFFITDSIRWKDAPEFMPDAPLKPVRKEN